MLLNVNTAIKNSYSNRNVFTYPCKLEHYQLGYWQSVRR